MADIFLSYTRSDRVAAQKLVDSLTSEGWTVFWDYKIPIGEDWDSVIEEELKKAKCVVVLWSRDSITHRWVRLEAKQELRRSILVPILIQETIEPPLEFQYVQAAYLPLETKRASEVASLEAYTGVRSAIEGFAPRIDIAGYWWMRSKGSNPTDILQITVLLVRLDTVDGTRLIHLQATVFDADARQSGFWASTTTNLERRGDFASVEYCFKHRPAEPQQELGLGTGIVEFDLRLKPPMSAYGFMTEIFGSTNNVNGASGRNHVLQLRRCADWEVEVVRNGLFQELARIVRSKLAAW